MTQDEETRKRRWPGQWSPAHLIQISAILTTLGGGAMGYGKLQQQSHDNTERIHAIDQEGSIKAREIAQRQQMNEQRITSLEQSIARVETGIGENQGELKNLERDLDLLNTTLKQADEEQRAAIRDLTNRLIK